MVIRMVVEELLRIPLPQAVVVPRLLPMPAVLHPPRTIRTWMFPSTST